MRPRAGSVVLDGPLYLTRALIEPMVKNRYGRILFFCGDGSISASGSGRTHLWAAKMGLIGMARGLASEFAPHNIRVNVKFVTEALRANPYSSNR
jgi:NAD(P)-dependent dehydrogenase (short-subunit alcohol dehydrogenase family)